MKDQKYILTEDGRTIVKASLIEWGMWLEKSPERHVGDTKVGDVRVSTVFLGLDHSFGIGPPLLFETMVFGGDHDGDERRYSTWEEAEAGHAEMCAKVFGEKP